MNARTGWNAAKLASERKLPTPRKMMGPVGEKRVPTAARIQDCLPLGSGVLEHNSCNDCGHHKCSCERRAPGSVLQPGMCQHCGSSGSHATDCHVIHSQNERQAAGDAIAEQIRKAHDAQVTRLLPANRAKLCTCTLPHVPSARCPLHNGEHA